MKKDTKWADYLIEAETYGECMCCKGVTDMVSVSFNTYMCSGECEKEVTKDYENKLMGKV